MDGVPFAAEVVADGLRRLGSGMGALDAEVVRLDAHLRSLSGAQWDAPTRCEEWSVRDVVAHLASGELYNEACLRGRLDELEPYDDDEHYNVMHVVRRRPLTPAAIYAEWRRRASRVHDRWRRLPPEHVLTTSVVPYPVGLQAWHIASEYATHAEDIGVPVPPEERAVRAAWRYEFSLYAVEERARPITLMPDTEGVTIIAEDRSYRLDAAEFTAAVSARLPLPGDPAAREVLVALRSLV